MPYNEDLTVNYAGVDAHCRDLAVHGVPFAFSASPRPPPAALRAAAAPLTTTHTSLPPSLSPRRRAAQSTAPRATA